MKSTIFRYVTHLHQILRISDLGLLNVLLGWSVLSGTAIAQISPDMSLGAERSQVSRGSIQGRPADVIQGGARRGGNLFHSFGDFNVGDQQRVYFANPVGVETILARITGARTSRILGTLGVNGTANLFLINPNGLFFGPNSRLDIRGSFLASTADSLVFDNSFVFSTKSPKSPPLLTIKAPIGLQFGANPGGIEIQGVRGSRLEAGDRQTLALVGGNITMTATTLRAVEGRVEVGAVGGNGFVAIMPTNPGFQLNYPPTQVFRDILLTQVASIQTDRAPDEPNSSGGSIQIQGQRVRLSNGSFINTTAGGSQNGGGLTIRATESLEVSGFHPEIIGRSGRLTTETRPRSTGNAGNLTIETKYLRVADGTILTTSTRGAGKGGDLIIKAQSVEVVGVNQTATLPSVLRTQTNEESTGNAGNITIDTQSLRVLNGGVISAITLGSGNGGNIIIRAESVDFSGTHPGSGVGFGRLGLEARPGSTGNAGNLLLETGDLRVTDGTFISAATSGSGDGGDVTIRARSIEVNGVHPIDGPSFISAQAYRNSTGRAGEIDIKTDRFTLANRGELRATSEGSKPAGSINVQANSQIILDQGRMLSNTQGEQGNITLTTPLLLMRRNSAITTNASGVGMGGNIAIAADFIIAGPQENNDIIANGFAGSGGKITLSAQTILGFDLRNRQDLQRLLNSTNPANLDPQRLSSNDVTAFSQANPTLDTGTITVLTPGLDPTQGLTTLPTDLRDPTGLIATSCRGDQGNSFMITGRAGVPEDPRQPLMADVLWGEGPVALDARQADEPKGAIGFAKLRRIAEAQGWMIDPSGRVVLVGGQDLYQNPIECKQELGRYP